MILSPGCTYLKREYTGKGTDSWDRNAYRSVSCDRKWWRGEEVYTSKAMAGGLGLIHGQVCSSEARAVVPFYLRSSTWRASKG